MTRFGYLVPEFPGQTHSFFWREVVVLRELGQEPELVSTRLPTSGTAPHAWAHRARSQTHYLVPPSASDISRALATLGHGPLSRTKSLGQAVLRRIEAGHPHGARSSAKEVARQASLLLAGAELAGLARSRGWSHIHVHSLAEAAQTTLYAHLLSGVPYSLTMHGPLADYGPNQREKWRQAEFVIVITEKLLHEAQELLTGDLPAVVEVAPMGVDVSRFARHRAYEPWDGEGSAKIFSCGRLNPSKGHDDLFRAVRLLLRDGIDVHLRIAGEDDSRGYGYRRELTELLRSLKLEMNVELLGALSEDDVRAELEAAHVFALASHAEPLGVATMEAMAMQLPVVVTAAGGVRELVRDRTDGFLVPARRPDCIATALRGVLSRPDVAEVIGIAARRRVVDRFSSHRSAHLLAELLNSSAQRQLRP